MEYFDVCDEHGRPTGEIVSRERAHREGIAHRTAHVWLLRRRQGRLQVLLQKRSQNKDSFPGLYDTSSAGHIPAGEEPLASALRELGEELGIEAEAEQLRHAGHFHIHYEKVFHGALFRDNEYAEVYVRWAPVEDEKIRLQAEEVEEARWFDLAETAPQIPKRRDLFCVPREGLQVLLDYLDREGIPMTEE